GDVVAGVGGDGEGLAGAGVDHDRAARGDGAVGAGRGGQGVGVDREAGGDDVVGGDVGEGVAGERPDRAAVDQQVGDVVVGVGGDGEGLIGAVVERHDPVRGDGAVGAGRGGDRVLPDREVRVARVAAGVAVVVVSAHPYPRLGRQVDRHGPGVGAGIRDSGSDRVGVCRATIGRVLKVDICDPGPVRRAPGDALG